MVTEKTNNGGFSWGYYIISCRLDISSDYHGMGVINHSMGGYYGDIDIAVLRYSQQPTIWFMIYT
jgi:hypothetical protein